MMKKKGYFPYLLAIDCETSGFARGCDDPSFDPIKQKEYQAVSWGMGIVDTTTFEFIEKFYVEIQWNGVSEWSTEAEKIHGLSKEYLATNGVSEEEAALLIGEFLAKYFINADESLRMIRCFGHNVATFDVPFLKRHLRKFDLEFNFGHRHLDTNSLSLCTFGTFNSEDMFQIIGMPPRGKHNSLEDIERTVEVARTIKQIWQNVVTPLLESE